MSNEPLLIACKGCGAKVPDLDEACGPEHSYVGASPGCWQIFVEVGAKDFPGTTARTLLVDTYMVQHPGVPSRQAIQSVARHLLGLYWALENPLPFDKALRAMQNAPVGQFVWLEPPTSFGPLTIVDIAQASSETIDSALIRRWAETTWAAWNRHYATIRNWAALSFS